MLLPGQADVPNFGRPRAFGCRCPTRIDFQRPTAFSNTLDLTRVGCACTTIDSPFWHALPGRTPQ